MIERNHEFNTLFLRFRRLQPGIRRNSFYGKHLYEAVREAEIQPQLSATQGFRVIFANYPPETQDEPQKNLELAY